MKNIFKEEYFQRGQRTARRIQKGIEKTGKRWDSKEIRKRENKRWDSKEKKEKREGEERWENKEKREREDKGEREKRDEIREE